MNHVQIPKWFTSGAWYVALIGVSMPFVFPFLWMISGSLKTAGEILSFPPTLVPKEWRWQNFREVFTYQPFARQYFNSLYIAVLVTLGTLVVSSLAGYAFARLQFRGNVFLFLLLLSALMMPSEATIIPNFFLMKFLGFINTHVPLIVLPVLGAHSVSATFLMRQFFLGIPKELEDAAMIDGLGRLSVFWRIALPIARPALGAVSIIVFLYSWNLYLEPLVFVNDVQLFTLPLALNNFTDTYGLPIWHLQLAATTLAVLPVLVVYVFQQQQIVESFAMSGMKG